MNDNNKVARSFQFLKCTNEDCGCMQVVLFDDEGDPMARGVIEPEYVEEMLKAISDQYGFTLSRVQ